MCGLVLVDEARQGSQLERPNIREGPSPGLPQNIL